MKSATTIVLSVLLSAAALLAGYALHRPTVPGIMATASSESSGAVLSTGYFNSSVEALYYLDSQSGRLSAALMARSDPDFIKTYTRNIKAALSESLRLYPNVPVPQRPNFIMVSGESDARKVGAGETGNLAKSFIYVAETQTGMVLVYILPQEGDRDLPIDRGEIVFLTSARLNQGTGEIK